MNRMIINSLFLISAIGNAQTTGHKRTAEDIYFADPTIIREKGVYYLTGTGNNNPQGFTVLESTNLREWHPVLMDSTSYILKQGTHTFGNNGFWAPQWFKNKDSYFLTYTADEQTVLASAKTWLGPFLQTAVKPIDNKEKNIDSFLFRDDDGKYYLYHVRFNHGNYIWVGEFDTQKGTLKSETLKQCLTYSEPWESTPNYPSDPIMEGPTLIKLEGIYYLFYSANHFMNIDYAVGYATSTSPLGPWTKYVKNPIIHRNIVGENGSGHGDIFSDKKGKLYYVYHVHFSDKKVSPRKTRIAPLILKKGKTGIYDISIDTNNIIKPIKTKIYDPTNYYKRNYTVSGNM